METLGVPAEERMESLEVSFRHGPEIFSGDQIRLWHSATSFMFTPDYPHILQVLRLLADPTVVDGVVSWNCPRLKSIEFASFSGEILIHWSTGVSFDALADAILDLLSKRSESLDAVGSASTDGEWPLPVKIVKVIDELFERLEGKVPEGTELQ